MSSPEVQRRTGGRSARVRRAVLDATLQVVVEQGTSALSVGEIARLAGVHDTSIYRRWPTKEHLILDALLDASQAHIPIPDTGALRSDLVAFATLVADYLADPIGQALMTSMAVAGDDAPLAAARAQFWQSRFELARTIIDRAVTRGEVPVGTDPAMVLELTIAPVHFRALLTREPLDDDVIGRLVDLVIDGLNR
jgi:AcrR family transcriptional regulator